METGHRHFYQQVIYAPEQRQNTWWKIHFPPVSILALPQLWAQHQGEGRLRAAWDFCRHSSAIASSSSSVSAHLFTKIFAVNGNKKKKRRLERVWEHCLHPLHFFSEPQARDGKVILSSRGWTFPGLLNHLPLWQMTSRETLCGNFSYCSPPMSFPFPGWKLPTP